MMKKIRFEQVGRLGSIPNNRLMTSEGYTLHPIYNEPYCLTVAQYLLWDMEVVQFNIAFDWRLNSI